MGAAQIAAIATVVRPRPVTPSSATQRRGNNPAKPKAPLGGVRERPTQAAGGTTTGGKAPTSDSLELARVKAEVIELKKSTNQQLLTEVKFLRGKKTELEARVLTLTTFTKDLKAWDQQVKANGGVGLADHMTTALDKTTVVKSTETI